jgi:hypothetical protein
VTRTEADLLAALHALEQTAPEPGPALRAIRSATGPSRPRRPARGRRRTLILAASAVVCAGIAAALVLALLPGGKIAQRRTIEAGHAHLPSRTQPVHLSAQQVLLLAAAHVSAAPASGNYWHLEAVSGSVEPAGTKAHPYDIVWEGPTSVWYSKERGQLNWKLSDTSFYDHAVPLTPADQAAWRASGSPSGWYPNSSWNGAFTHRIGPVQQGYTWQTSDGVVGYTEGNLPGLTAAQFARLPSSVTGLRRYLFGVADSMQITRHNPDIAVALVWAEALNLLVDPVSGQVRAAAYRVMATLPEVKLLGLVRDAFGRQGYGLQISDDGLFASPGDLGAIVDPSTGELLDTSNQTYGTSINSGSQVCRGNLVPKNLSPEAWVQWTQNPANRHLSTAEINRRIKQFCPFVVQYYGRPYLGLLDNYEAFFASGWVNALPHVPPATQANEGFVFLSAG